MSLLLRIDSGSRKGELVPLQPGVPLRVGRTDRADVALADDTFLSSIHFELLQVGDTCTLRDLQSRNGTTFRGAPVTQSQLRGGDSFVAGQTRFHLLAEAGKAATPQAVAAATPKAPPPAAPEPLLPASRHRLLAEMRTGLQPLYAVLDAARDPRVLAALTQHRSQYAWLFEQGTPAELMSFAPYLVPLAAASPVLETLVDMGWTEHWGIYLTSTAGAGELIASLRKLLLADQPDGQQAFLRFYDPRVLRTLLSESTPWQWPWFFRAVRSYLVPGNEPQSAVSFTQTSDGLERSDIFLGEDGRTERKPIEWDSRGGQRPPNAGDRLVLSAKQMQALKAQESDPFEEALLKEMRERYPNRFAQIGDSEVAEWITHGCRRSKRYGIQAEHDVRAYVALAVQLGRDFDADLPWASDLLRLRLDPKEKLARLTAKAGEYLSAAQPA